jgi:hypothetical protein
LYKLIVKKMTFVDIMLTDNYNKITKWSYQFTVFGWNRGIAKLPFCNTFFTHSIGTTNYNHMIKELCNYKKEKY